MSAPRTSRWLGVAFLISVVPALAPLAPSDGFALVSGEAASFGGSGAGISHSEFESSVDVVTVHLELSATSGQVSITIRDPLGKVAYQSPMVLPGNPLDVTVQFNSEPGTWMATKEWLDAEGRSEIEWRAGGAASD